MKKFFVLFLSLVLVSALCSCGNNNTEQITEPTTIEYKDVPSATDETVSDALPTESEPEAVSDSQITTPSTSQTPVSREPTSQAPTTQQTQPPTEVATFPETTKKQLQKTGEMEFSDSANNKYIKAVVNKYGVDPSRLAAIYTVPDNNGNLVLEFDGSNDSKGRLIRTEDTLIAIYSVDKELNCKRASQNSSLNEYSYGEMMVMFVTTKKHIMPEFQAELNG